MFYIQRLLQWLRGRFFSKELELSVVGLQNAGKSTLINSLQTGQFMEDSIPTVGVNIRQVKQGKVTLKIWDLGGQ
jgi:small GTP-binding protein